MSFDAHKNFAYTTVATAPAPAASGTSLVVAAGDGTKFPAVPFNATIWPINTQPTAANAEIVRVTNISTDTLTITRAQESSSARTVLVGDQIAATITAKTLTDVENTLPTGTSGGIPAYTSASSTFVSSAALGANALMLGGGAGVVPFTDSNLTVNQTSHQLSSATQYRSAAYNSTTQSINSGADTAVTFDTEDFDVGNLHSTVSNTSRFTIPASGDGFFMMTANIFLGASATGILNIDWKKNGTTKIGSGQFIGNSAANAVMVEHTAYAALVATDYVEVIVNQNSGGALNIGSATRTLASQATVIKLW